MRTAKAILEKVDIDGTTHYFLRDNPRDFLYNDSERRTVAVSANDLRRYCANKSEHLLKKWWER